MYLFKEIKMKIISIAICCFISALWSAQCAEHQEPWRTALSISRKSQHHGQQLVDNVYRNLGDLPSIYKAGSYYNSYWPACLGGTRAPEFEFDNYSLSSSATEAAKKIVEASLCKTLSKLKFAELVPCNGIDWSNVSGNGRQENDIIEIFTPINWWGYRNCYFLFSVKLDSYDLELTDTRAFGIYGYKKVKMKNINGSYGMLYFSTDRGKQLI